MCLRHRCIICIEIQLLCARITVRTNNHAHLIRRNYKQWQLHFQCSILYVFVKRLLRNFYSVARNSKSISSCTFTSISSQNAEKRNRQTYFSDLLCSN